MATGSQVNVIVPQQKGDSTSPFGSGQGTPNAPLFFSALSDEGVKVYERLVDPDALYLKDMTRLLYCADLVKTEGNIDPDSPIAGYTLVKPNRGWHPNTNLDGYLTITHSFMFNVNQVQSTTETEGKMFDLEAFCITKTMSILDMICGHWEEWEFKSPMLLGPLGFGIWHNMVAVGHRSHHGGKMMKYLFHPAVFGAPNPASEEKKSRWSL